MPRMALTRERTLLALILGLLILSQLPTKAAGVLWSEPAYLFRMILQPPAYALKRLSDKLRPPGSAELVPQDYTQLKSEYERLVQQSRRLEQDLLEARQQIEQLSGVRQRFPDTRFGLIAAAVTNWSGDPLNPTLTINRGSEDGLRVNQPVVQGLQLVGWLEQVQPRLATVRLISRPRTKMGVRLAPPRAAESKRSPVLLELEADATGLRLMGELTKVENVKEGDWAHLHYDPYAMELARGFLVGQVEKIRPSPQDPHHRYQVVVRPVVGLAKLGYVSVVVPP